MQKTTDASILIWSLFLSLFVAFAFLSISTAVFKNIQWVSYISQMVDTNFQMPNLSLTWNAPIFVSSDIKIQKDMWNKLELMAWEGTEIRFSKNSQVNMTFTTNNGWPVFYEFISINNITKDGVVSASGTIVGSTSVNGNLDMNRSNGILYLRNLWGYVSLDYDSSDDFIIPVDNYMINKKVGGKYLQKSYIHQKNFDLWDYPWFDYYKYELNF